MWSDRVSNPGPLTYESGALHIALRGPAQFSRNHGFDAYRYTIDNVRTEKICRVIKIIFIFPPFDLIEQKYAIYLGGRQLVGCSL